jgi:hypothetical protein
MTKSCTRRDPDGLALSAVPSKNKGGSHRP